MLFKLFRRLLPFVRPYRWSMFFGSILAVFTTAFGSVFILGIPNGPIVAGYTDTCAWCPGFEVECPYMRFEIPTLCFSTQLICTVDMCCQYEDCPYSRWPSRGDNRRYHIAAERGC